MTNDYSKRLSTMRIRRHGDSVLESFSKSNIYDSYSRLLSHANESYEIRGETDTFRYVLGAMQAVDCNYTNVSIEAGERVKSLLTQGLDRAGIAVEFEYQGSVPLDIHIKRHSDIDLLVLLASIHTYDPNGRKSLHGTYSHKPAKPILDHMVELRRLCELTLTAAFSDADVDISGSKSISLKGESLRRKVDVVPSHWHDTSIYQQTGAKHDRGVKVLDKTVPTTISNSPFLHMKRVNEKNMETKGGAKKVIRFLKTLKADSDQGISLSSYDVASLVWHFSSQGLVRPDHREIALIADTQVELNAMCQDSLGTKRLMTPDGSRAIIDSSQKFLDLRKLATEVDIVAADIAKEIDPTVQFSPERIRPALESVTIW